MQIKLKRILSEEKIQEIKLMMLLEKKHSNVNSFKEDKFLFFNKLIKFITLSNS